MQCGRRSAQNDPVADLTVRAFRQTEFHQLKAFFDEVINGQNVEVDAISGATLDSNNLLDALKAIFK